MSNWADGTRLRLYLDEGDRHGSAPAFEWVVAEARRRRLAGATVMRGLEGFGARRHLHSAHLLALADDLPVVVEIVDAADRIEEFADFLDAELTNGLATLEPVRFRGYHPPG